MSRPIDSSVQNIEEKVDQLYTQAGLFAKGALTYKMLSKEQASLIHSAEQHKPEELFGSNQNKRPLVVAFFGGTGVGKSTLLNRFAGKTIARTGVERPTSREVTIFVHNSIEIRQLPKDFPLDKVNIRQHQDELKREIMWIDMPDIDSVETENLEVVRDWVPYIDVLLYVVSPERYRDDKGWQFLLDQGYKHAWLFVINQWGQGDESVLHDFEAQLQKAGFDQPLIYRTDCLSDKKDDDFDELSQNLLGITNDHTINELDRHGIWNRLLTLQGVLQQQIQSLGEREWFDQLEQMHKKRWSQASRDIFQHLELPIQKSAAKFTKPTFSLIDRFRSKNNNETDDQFEIIPSDQNGWDGRAQTIVEGELDKVVLEADSLGLPAEQIKAGLLKLRLNIEERMNVSMQTGLQQCLANPGNRLHRFVHQILGIMTTSLPVAALAWVAYRVIVVFNVGQGSDYLGANFAIHSFLLVLVAWLIPYLLHKKSRPSLQKAAKKGLENGLFNGLADIEVEISSALSQSRQLHEGLMATGEDLLKASSSIKPVHQVKTGSTLSRMLQKELHSKSGTPKLQHLQHQKGEIPCQ